MVADEVRALADKTRQSTLHIQAIIDTLRSGAEEAVAIASQGITGAEQGVARYRKPAKHCMAFVMRCSVSVT